MNRFKSIIQQLIALSEIESSSDSFKIILEKLKKEDDINRLGPQQWYALLEPYSVSDCVKIASGLALAEAINHWCGGSVAGIIWVYNEIARRDHTKAEELAFYVEETWRNLNYENSWAKFVYQAREKRKAKLIEEEIRGLITKQSKTEQILIQELGIRTWLSRKARFLENELSIVKQLQNGRTENNSLKNANSSLTERVDELMAKNSELRVTNRQLQKYYNTHERRLLIQKGDSVGVREKIAIICQDGASNINSFPETWAKNIAASLTGLNDQEIAALFERTQRATSKAWRNLKKELEITMHNKAISTDAKSRAAE